MTKHTNCTNCGAKLGGMFGRHDVGDGICVPCDAERLNAAYANLSSVDKAAAEAEAAVKVAVAGMLVTTEAAPIGIAIEQRLGIVSADVAFGAGPLKDIAVGLRDAFGGRSETVSKLLRDSRATALDELRREAHALGANALIGVAFTVTSIGHSSMTLVSATGTAATVN